MLSVSKSVRESDQSTVSQTLKVLHAAYIPIIYLFTPV